MENLVAPARFSVYSIVMKKLIATATCVILLTAAAAQSKTTNALQSTYSESLTLFFYKNTLRMLNQGDNKEYDEMIRNIEKLKLLMIDKGETKFGDAQLAKLISDYKKEEYEPVMTSRMDGRNLNVYMKEKKGSPLGTVVLVNDSSSLFVLDMIGTIDISKAGSLFKALDDNSEVGKQITDFMTRKDKGKKKKERGIKID